MRFTLIISVHESGYFDFSLNNLSSTASSASVSAERKVRMGGSQVGAGGFHKGTLEGNAAQVDNQ